MLGAGTISALSYRIYRMFRVNCLEENRYVEVRLIPAGQGESNEYGQSS